MKWYGDLFPDERVQAVSLELPRKTGGIPKGNYAFLECYCTEPGCDCRRVALLVVDGRMKRKALIRFGFDGDGACDGPFLDPTSHQSPCAPLLLEFFVNTLNSRPDWLLCMYAQYRNVRELVDGRRYAGASFPEPGDILYRPHPAPDLESFLEESLRMHRHRSVPRFSGLASIGERPGAERGTDQDHEGMMRFVTLYAQTGPSAPVGILLALREEYREHLLARPEAAEELAALLPELCRRSPQDEESIEAALRMLCDTLEFMQVELEGGRPGAGARMQRLQEALYQRVFLESRDPDLRLAVCEILSAARMLLITELAEALRDPGGSDPDGCGLQDVGEDVMGGIARHFEAAGVTSPFEGVREMLDLFAINDPDLQAPLLGELLISERKLFREVAALMIFHPDGDLAREVAQLLAIIDGGRITPDTLRRLIVARNWLPEEMRKGVDQAIANARRARVECAHLAKAPALTVYAAPPDEVGTEGFKIVIEDGDGFYACSILLKDGVGVADAFVMRLKSQAEVESLVGKLENGEFLAESSMEHLDRALCRALTEGAAQGRVPSFWLVRVAELMGCDRWKASRHPEGR